MGIEANYEIAYVRYQDHHWFDSHVLLKDIEKLDRGENQAVISEVGFLIKSTKKYIILAQGIEPPLFQDEDDSESLLVKPTKILKRDIVQMTTWSVPRPRNKRLRG